MRNPRKPSDRELIIWLGNNDKVKAKHIGDISLDLSTRHILEFRNVVYVCSMKRNLILVTTLDFNRYFCFLIIKSLNYFIIHFLVGSSVLSNRLYKIDLNHNFTNSINIVIGKKNWVKLMRILLCYGLNI